MILALALKWCFLQLAIENLPVMALVGQLNDLQLSEPSKGL